MLTELSLNYKNSGVFVRASAQYDDAAAHTARTPLSDASKDLVQSYVRLLDAFFYTKFNIGSMNSELRLGRQAATLSYSRPWTTTSGALEAVGLCELRVPDYRYATGTRRPAVGA